MSLLLMEALIVTFYSHAYTSLRYLQLDCLTFLAQTVFFEHISNSIRLSAKSTNLGIHNGAVSSTPFQCCS
jgi:hypothetical protein